MFILYYFQLRGGSEAKVKAFVLALKEEDDTTNNERKQQADSRVVELLSQEGEEMDGQADGRRER